MSSPETGECFLLVFQSECIKGCVRKCALGLVRVRVSFRHSFTEVRVRVGFRHSFTEVRVRIRVGFRHSLH